MRERCSLRDLELLTNRHGWQRQIKRRTTIRVVSGPEPATMRSNNRAANCQTQSHAVGFRGYEWIKHDFESFRCDPASSVTNYELNFFVFGNRRSHDEPAIGCLHTFHRIAGVDNEIDQHLLHLHTINRNQREIRGQVGCHHRLAADQVTVKKFQNFLRQCA